MPSLSLQLILAVALLAHSVRAGLTTIDGLACPSSTSLPSTIPDSGLASLGIAYYPFGICFPIGLDLGYSTTTWTQLSCSNNALSATQWAGTVCSGTPTSQATPLSAFNGQCTTQPSPNTRPPTTPFRELLVDCNAPTGEPALFANTDHVVMTGLTPVTSNKCPAGLSTGSNTWLASLSGGIIFKANTRMQCTAGTLASTTATLQTDRYNLVVNSDGSATLTLCDKTTGQTTSYSLSNAACATTTIKGDGMTYNIAYQVNRGTGINSGTGLSGGGIAGVVLGALVFIGLVWFACWRRRAMQAMMQAAYQPMPVCCVSND